MNNNDFHSMLIDKFHVIKIPKDDILYQFSDPMLAQKKAFDYAGLQLYKSANPSKKYMIINPITNKLVHFGAQGMEDYTKHKDKERRILYLKRATKIKGDWKNNPYSPNNLAINILW